VPNTTVFFADILGFSTMSRTDVAAAERALDDIEMLFSDHDELSAYLQIGSPWTKRIGFSDSILLLAEDPIAACAAAAEFFFRLAYLNASAAQRAVLMRGAITAGDVRVRAPLFAESAKFNAVGAAVAEAAALEKSGPKGPRLLLSSSVADVLRQNEMGDWLLDESDGTPELLWLLPPDRRHVDGTMLRPVCVAASELFMAAPDSAIEHYAAYVDLLVRSLARLETIDPTKAGSLRDAAKLDEVERRMTQLVDEQLTPEQRALRRIREWR
jgi:class 3 adenylate cyclase